jgi:TM2 domain-containing membrane protein YozV
MEKIWEIKDPDQYLQPRKTKRETKGLPPLDEKNPARAYTLSLLVWGVGQNYNDQRGKGLLFLLSLIFVFVGVGLSVFFQDSLLHFLRTHGIPAARAFLLAELLFFLVLIFWMYIAGDAYHAAAKMRKTRFMGIPSRVYPFFCSFLLPGWGQFLNGQPVKGSVFSGLSVFALFSLVSVPAVLLAWPSLEVSEDRFIVEAGFAITVLYAPLIPFVWLVGSYDALKVSNDDLLKEPLWERLKAANNRRRTQGWIRGVFPHIKSTLALVLFLAVLALVIGRSFPASYYQDYLAHARARLQEQGMTIVPELINRMLSAAGG